MKMGRDPVVAETPRRVLVFLAAAAAPEAPPSVQAEEVTIQEATVRQVAAVCLAAPRALQAAVGRLGEGAAVMTQGDLSHATAEGAVTGAATPEAREVVQARDLRGVVTDALVSVVGVWRS